MNAITLEATTREVGTKASRALRRTGNVPCVLYGHNVEPVTFQVPELALRPLIYTDEFHQVELIIDGQQWTCMMKDIDFHPVSDRPIHADFQVLKRGEKITVVVPVQLTGTPLGKLEGGIVESEGYIDASNVMLVHPGDHKPSRTRVEERDGVRMRVFTRDGVPVPDAAGA